MDLPLPRLLNAEIVIGIVGRMGVDTRAVSQEIGNILKDFSYHTEHIQVSEHVREVPGLSPLKETPIEDRYESRIDACNEFREASGRNDILAFTSIVKIQNLRKALLKKRAKEGLARPDEVYAQRTAFVITQFKRVEEILLLRQVYGSQFIQISCHAERKKRLEVLIRKIRRDHLAVSQDDQLLLIANRLIDRDNAEAGKLTGQRVRDTFPLADLIINADNPPSMKESLERFFHALFGDFNVSPTRQEYGMNLAHIAALRSVDTSRQVGAAALSKQGEVLALGCNEVPKAGGGTYWYKDAGDGRDIKRGQDDNAIRKRSYLFDVIRILKNSKKLSDDISSLSDDELIEELIDRKSAILAESPILDLLEFNRNLHAEMNVITDAARLGVSLKGATLHSTTFPCHNCAKHIVGSGITEVFYLQPYSKSQVDELFDDSISVTGPAEGKVGFRQFIGITPRRYRALFEKERLKDDKGIIRTWDAVTASPNIDSQIPLYLSLEQWAITYILGAMKAEVREHLTSGTNREIILVETEK